MAEPSEREGGPHGWAGLRVWTVGHSTRPIEDFLDVLASFGITTLADIRTVRRSRRNPQFGADALSPALTAAGIDDAPIPELGGLRRARPDSPNAGWRNASFRGYADHMLTDTFEVGLRALRALAGSGRVAMMCAEAVPWRCHRSLVADALTVRGAEVVHIMGVGRSHPHRLTRFAQVDGARVTYPGDPEASGSAAAPSS